MSMMTSGMIIVADFDILTFGGGWIQFGVAVAAIVGLSLWIFGGELYERVRVWSGLPPMKKDNVADGEAEEGE